MKKNYKGILAGLMLAALSGLSFNVVLLKVNLLLVNGKPLMIAQVIHVPM